MKYETSEQPAAVGVAGTDRFPADVPDDRVVELQDIVKNYGRICALCHVSMVIGHGITGLLGPNGAGKTTLIKVLLGLVRVSSGRGSVLGYDLLRSARSIRQNVGFMPEDDCYISGLSGVEMVQFAARLSGYPRTESLRRSHEILDFCGVDQERYREVDTYSTGMRQKVKFAQAIVHDPPLLILDEPTDAVDSENVPQLLDYISRTSEEIGQVLLVTHHGYGEEQGVNLITASKSGGESRVQQGL